MLIKNHIISGKPWHIGYGPARLTTAFLLIRKASSATYCLFYVRSSLWVMIIAVMNLRGDYIENAKILS